MALTMFFYVLVRFSLPLVPDMSVYYSFIFSDFSVFVVKFLLASHVLAPADTILSYVNSRFSSAN